MLRVIEKARVLGIQFKLSSYCEGLNLRVSFLSVAC